MRDRVRLLLAIALLATVVRPAGPAHAATIAVTTTEDELATNGRCSLREAVRNANADADLHPDCPRGTGQDRIVLAPGTYTLALGGRGGPSARRA
jgi:CSLREA domain-containing protein